MSSSPKIPAQFYEDLFLSSQSYFNESRDSLSRSSNKLSFIMDVVSKRRTSNGLKPQDIGVLLTLLQPEYRGTAEGNQLRNVVLSKSRALREKLYRNDVAVMIPIEISSYCASNCSFCGWRSDNKDMLRLKVSKQAVMNQLEQLSQHHFSHYEIVAGDDLNFIKDDLPDLVKAVKEKLKTLGSNARVSICLTPLHESHYRNLKDQGLDTVLTWQETYNFENYRKLITVGPKAKGITESFKVAKEGDGCLVRMQSHELAVRAGLQVGLGVMLGLDENHPEADILSAIRHGTQLIETYHDTIQPIILGMPIWNPITTKRTDNSTHHKTKIVGEEDFELISAIYLLSFPDRFAWVFPNCRVSKAKQIASIQTAGCFTSGMVRVGPGAYLDLSKPEDFGKVFAKSSEDIHSLTQDRVLNGEQFVHHFDTQENYNRKFKEAKISLVQETKFLSEFNEHQKKEEKAHPKRTPATNQEKKAD